MLSDVVTAEEKFEFLEAQLNELHCMLRRIESVLPPEILNGSSGFSALVCGLCTMVLRNNLDNKYLPDIMSEMYKFEEKVEERLDGLYALALRNKCLSEDLDEILV